MSPAFTMTPEERAKAVLQMFHRDCLCEHEEWLIAQAIRASVEEALLR